MLLKNNMNIFLLSKDRVLNQLGIRISKLKILKTVHKFKYLNESAFKIKCLQILTSCSSWLIQMKQGSNIRALSRNNENL